MYSAFRKSKLNSAEDSKQKKDDKATYKDDFRCPL